MPALLTKTLWTAYALGAWPGSPLIDGGVVTLADRADGIKFLLRDQGTTFTGADAGVIVYGVSRLLYAAIAAGVAAGALALGWATWYQWRHWCQASPPSSREITPGPAARAGQRPLRRAGGQQGAGRDAAT